MAQHRTSILKKILLPILALMIVQTALLYGVIVFGGTVEQLRSNSLDIFSEKVSSRKLNLENEMVQRWSNVSETVAKVTQDVQLLLDENGAEARELTPGSALTDEVLTQLADDLIYLLRRNSVTGAFLVLEGDGALQKAGIYLRDPDPNFNPNNYSDLSAQVAPSALTKKLNIAFDSLWQPQFDFARMGEQDIQFYTKPFEAAVEFPEIEYSDLGYWGTPFSLESSYNDPYQMITYSVPLREEDGTVYGVLGVEISVDYLQKQLPVQELGVENRGGYVLAVGTLEGDALSSSMEVVAKSGAALSSVLGKEAGLEIEQSRERGLVAVVDQNGNSSNVCGYIQRIQLYNTHTPFEQEQWVLAGVVYRDALFGFADRFGRAVLLVALLALVIGVVGVVVVSRFVTKPIAALTKQLRNQDPNKPIVLDELHINEIDALSGSIQYFSSQVADSARKLSTILEMTGASVGAFEYSRALSTVFCTDQFQRVMRLPELETKGGYLSLEKFGEWMGNCAGQLEMSDAASQIYLYKMEDTDGPRWVRLKITTDKERVLGVASDVTQEILEKQRLERERDYDALSELYNRRALHTRLAALFAAPEKLGVAAMMMMDLDNLKFINDTYGHDYGDEYIRSAGAVLRRFESDHAVAARLSGDEFVLFMYGYADRDEIQTLLEALRRRMQETRIYLPDRTNMQIRASAGVAWYPDDADNYEELLRFADFAMYLVKRTDKGQFNDFSIESYNREAYLLRCREELNTIIEEQQVDYQFQPIVDARTGEVYAFEALLRPRTQSIQNPTQLISLARSQSKLSQIERLTMFRSMECFLEQEVSHSGCKLFVNSIANQILSPEDLEKFEGMYAEQLHRIVVELTEDERDDAGITALKQQIIARWNGELALDDFGVGYNGESALVDVSPNYVKIDISIVRNIHADPNRLKLLQNIVGYAQGRNLKVIAEGVERREEMEVLIHAGVDYLQGYYLGKPTYQPSMQLHELREEIRAISGMEL